MAKLALIYGMRLLPADEIEDVGEAEIKLKNGKTAHVTMHLIDGGEKEIRAATRAVAGRVFRVLSGNIRLGGASFILPHRLEPMPGRTAGGSRRCKLKLAPPEIV